MDKVKLLFIGVFIIFIVTSFISYIYKKPHIYAFSIIVLVISSFLLFIGVSSRTNKISKILIGDYTLKQDISIETVYNKEIIEKNIEFNQLAPSPFSNNNLFFSSKIPRLREYMLVSMILSTVLLFLLKIYRFELLFKLINPGLALISIGLALSIVSFNYSKSENFENKKIIFSSARRYFLSAIYAIFSLILLVVMISCRYLNHSNDPLSLDSITFISCQISMVIANFTLWFYILTSTTSIRFLIEAMTLSFKGTVDL